MLQLLPPMQDFKAKALSYNKTYNGSGNGAFLAVVAVPRINKLCAVNTLDRPTPTPPPFFIINQLQALRFFTKLYSQSVAIFRTWVPSEGYISIESLNRHHFLVCNDVLQQLHPLRPKTAKNRVAPTNKTWAQQQSPAFTVALALTSIPSNAPGPVSITRSTSSWSLSR
jgi:hypothetical protein